MQSALRRFKSLKHFIRDGLWASFCEGIAEANFSSFAVALSATASQIGLISATQQLGGCWLQLWSEKLTAYFGSRKKLVLCCVAFQTLMLTLMIAAALQSWGVLAFATIAIAFTAVGNLSAPVWSTWVSDLLPNRRRGACFAIRNQRTYPASFIALVIGGFILDRLGAARGLQFAFCTVFALGLVAKLCSLRHLFLQQEPAFEPPRIVPGPLRLIAAAYRDQQTRKMLLFFGSMGLAINLSSPFQTPYLLKTLNFNYVQFTFLVAAMSMSRFLATPLLGKAIDRMGSKKLLSRAALLMPLIPFGWCFTKSYAGLFAIQLFAGAVWAAFDLCSFTYLVEATPAHKRPRVFAAKHVFWNLSSFLGATLGSLLVKVSTGIVFAFWVSTFARAGAALVLVTFVVTHKEQPLEEIPLRESA